MLGLSRLSLSARLYFVAVIAGGCAVAAFSAGELYVDPPPRGWLVLAALTTLTGTFTVRVPSISARLSVSDAFVFASVFLFGPATATTVVTLDCLVMIAWSKRSLLQSLFNLSATALAIWTASHAFYWLAGAQVGERLVLTSLLGPLFVLAALYFIANTGLVAIALSFERHANPWVLWREHFPWFSLNYFGGVSVAALLASYTRTVDLAAVSIILPLLTITYLTYRASFGRLQDAQRHIEQVNELYMSTIEALAMAVDAKDQITHGHIRRVQVYAVELAKRLGVSDERQLKAIATAALLHDMGKLAIPEHILNKPGKLTAAEFDKMKRHADIGADLLSSVRFPYPVVPIVRHHHEHWDGKGYPTGISGTDIPLGARILSVVDGFDALTSDRPYRPRLTTEHAFQIIREGRGTLYDPLVVDKFITAYEEIAPAAIQAGQQARSFIDAASIGAAGSQDDTSAPLRQIRANASETAALDRCSKEVAKAKSSTTALHVAAQYLRQLTPATVYACFVYDSSADILTCIAASGDEQRLLDGLTIRLGEKVTGWTAANHRTSVNSDAFLDLGEISTFFVPVLRSTLSTPLTLGETLVGVLTGYSSKKDAFNDAHRYTFEEVGSVLVNKISSLQSVGLSKIVSFPHQKR
jgi:putative nucleotidyltransferase with HDIG domain